MHAGTYRRALALLVPALGALLGATVVAAPAQASLTCSTTYRVLNVWPKVGDGSAGFTGEFTVTNTGTDTMKGWHIEVHFQTGVRVTTSWDAVIAFEAAPVYVFDNLSSNGQINAGQSKKFGVIARKSADTVPNVPRNITCTPQWD